MNREHLLWAGIVIALLAVGLWIGRQFAAWSSPTDATFFRRWFWEARSLDLAVQAALVLVGALGAAALLPRDREGRE